MGGDASICIGGGSSNTKSSRFGADPSWVIPDGDGVINETKPGI